MTWLKDCPECKLDFPKVRRRVIGDSDISIALEPDIGLGQGWVLDAVFCRRIHSHERSRGAGQRGRAHVSC